MRAFARLWIGGVLLSVAACSGRPDQPIQANVSAQNQPQILYADLVHQEVSRSGFTRISITVEPRSLCHVQSIGTVTSSAQGLELASSDEGFIRWYVSKPPSSGSVNVVCNTETGSLSVHPVALDLVDSMAPQPPEKPIGILRQALAGDPLTYTQRELHDRGFSPRPDPNTNPRAFQRWTDQVSKPTTIVSSTSVKSTRHRRAAAEDDTADSNGVYTSGRWSGSAMTSTDLVSPNLYVAALGYVQVPSINPGWNQGISPANCEYSSLCSPDVPGCWVESDSVLWVGIDGKRSKDVIQAGSESIWDGEAVCGGPFTPNQHYDFYTYQPWWEWYPGDPSVIPQSVSAGDILEVYVDSGDANGNMTPYGGYADYYIWNEGTVSGNSWVWSQTVAPPTGVVFQGTSAEWIMERPLWTDFFNNSYYEPFSKYDPASLYDPIAFLWSPYATETPTPFDDTTMCADPPTCSNILSESSYDMSSQVVYFFWNNWQ